MDEITGKKLTRREFLELGVQTAVTMVTLTACGKVFAMGKVLNKKIEEITVGEDNFIITLEELRQYQAVNFILKGKKSILIYNSGQVKAFENICTHKGGPTSLKEGSLVCQWHGEVFDPLTGEALRGPAPKGSKLTPISLEEHDGKMYVSNE